VEVIGRSGQREWTRRFGVTLEELKIAVFEVGTNPAKVAARLGKDYGTAT
jgi:hypothetical protein